MDAVPLASIGAAGLSFQLEFGPGLATLAFRVLINFQGLGISDWDFGSWLGFGCAQWVSVQWGSGQWLGFSTQRRAPRDCFAQISVVLYVFCDFE